ncbi:hypothetical protein D3C76_1664200 [compost metagenome]
MVDQNSDHSALSQRPKNGLSSALSSGSSGVCKAAGCGSLAVARCTSQAMPSTMITPATSRIAANCQPSTKPIKISVAGFSTGLLSQNAIAAPLDTD